ncbi:family 10 glycosylhydrolase [Cyanobium sp. FGCU-52]|nr:family 10 glycosylhydrolase [Cyanobium sp. FGCU52]
MAERSPASPLRGVWIAEGRHSPVLRSAEGIARALERLVALGFTTLFPAVWNRGATAFPSRVMERHGFAAQDPLYGDFDPLAELVRQARPLGLAVIPWFEYGFAASPQADGAPLLTARPDWAARDPRGALVRHGPLLWMNGLHPEVQQLLIDLAVEVLDRYDVQGIQGDDRWPALPWNAGYDPWTRRAWRAAGGGEPPPPRHPAWMAFRADRLTEHLRELRQAVHRARPGALVSMAPAPLPHGIRELLQDSGRWMREGLVDLLHPQLYRSDPRAYGALLERTVRGWSAEQRARLAPGLSLRVHGRTLAPATVAAMLQRHRPLGLAGAVVFHYDGLEEGWPAEALPQAGEPQAGDPSGPRVAGRWPVLTQIVQPRGLRG